MGDLYHAALVVAGVSASTLGVAVVVAVLCIRRFARHTGQ